DRPAGALSNPLWRANDRHAWDLTFSSSLLAERRSSSPPGDGSFLHGPWRVCDIHSGFCHFHCVVGAGIFPRGTLRHSAMAISTWHLDGVGRSVRRDLVSGQRATPNAFGAYCIARIVHRFYGNVLLGALRCSD